MWVGQVLKRNRGEPPGKPGGSFCGQYVCRRDRANGHLSGYLECPGVPGQSSALSGYHHVARNAVTMNTVEK